MVSTSAEGLALINVIFLHDSRLGEVYEKQKDLWVIIESIKMLHDE